MFSAPFCVDERVYFVLKSMRCVPTEGGVPDAARLHSALGNQRQLGSVSSGVLCSLGGFFLPFKVAASIGRRVSQESSEWGENAQATATWSGL